MFASFKPEQQLNIKTNNSNKLTYDFNRPIDWSGQVDWLGLAPEGRKHQDMSWNQKKNFKHGKYRLLRNNKKWLCHINNFYLNSRISFKSWHKYFLQFVNIFYFMCYVWILSNQGLVPPGDLQKSWVQQLPHCCHPAGLAQWGLQHGLSYNSSKTLI